MGKYSVEEVRAKLGFSISDVEPRILTWESGGCHPASIAECALWDAYAELIKADESAVPAAGTPERQLFDLAHAWGANKIHNYQLMHHIEQIVKKLRTAAQPRAVPDDEIRSLISRLRHEDDSDEPVTSERRAGWRAALDAIEEAMLAAAPSPGESA